MQRLFPSGCVASPHHLASAAGQAVLADGGNAVDAAVAANLVLAVVTPYHCGLGGDLFAIVADAAGPVTAYASNGRAPAGATLEQVRAAAGADRMPRTGPLTVTVPGAVAGWHALLARHGSRPFAAVAAPAIRLARDGFVVSTHAAAHFAAPRDSYAEQPGWTRAFGSVDAGTHLRQPGLADALDRIATEGPDGFYDGPIAADIVATLQAGASAMTRDDLRAHEVAAVKPLTGRFGGTEVLELPPPTQGVSALTALGIVEAAGLPTDPVDRTHLQIEAVRAALADRTRYVTDPDHMPVEPTALLASDRLAAVAAAIDPRRASPWPVATPAPGGTAYLCAADGDGGAVSLIQSNFMGFGSGVVVEPWGIALQNRGAQFSLDPDHVNVIAGGKRTLHTLIPALVLRDGRPWLVFGTMGGDGQPQTHLQVLSRIVLDGSDPQPAIDAPRWVVSAEDGTVAVERRLGAQVVQGLQDRGHAVQVLGDYEHLMGHAHAIRLDLHARAGATDPRAEGAVVGL